MFFLNSDLKCYHYANVFHSIMLLITIKSVLILVKMYHDLEYRLVKEFHWFLFPVKLMLVFWLIHFQYKKNDCYLYILIQKKYCTINILITLISVD